MSPVWAKLLFSILRYARLDRFMQGGSGESIFAFVKSYVENIFTDLINNYIALYLI
jgi:hypothetical protein